MTPHTTTIHSFQKKQCDMLNIFYPSNTNFTQILFTRSYHFPSLVQFNIKHKVFLCLFIRHVSVMLRGPPMDSETGWTGELWSKTNLLFFFRCCEKTS